ncbi:hypothetical protein E2C01_058917 [Portunus trituberculatus]|uniref:Uncharacterized protein n=1 Tax=Portunus trituberculatus TaxID=210409 RepID=A0A5B7H5G4_PORTR|nr:hypothetical protein [Portunus trituberculatus]
MESQLHKSVSTEKEACETTTMIIMHSTMKHPSFDAIFCHFETHLSSNETSDGLPTPVNHLIIPFDSKQRLHHTPQPGVKKQFNHYHQHHYLLTPVVPIPATVTATHTWGNSAIKAEKALLFLVYQQPVLTSLTKGNKQREHRKDEK